jgi:hypothetical protein
MYALLDNTTNTLVPDAIFEDADDATAAAKGAYDLHRYDYAVMELVPPAKPKPAAKAPAKAKTAAKRK